MSTISCPACGAAYQLEPARFPAAEVRAGCLACGHELFLRLRGRTDGFAPTGAAAPGAGSSQAGPGTELEQAPAFGSRDRGTGDPFAPDAAGMESREYAPDAAEMESQEFAPDAAQAEPKEFAPSAADAESGPLTAEPEPGRPAGEPAAAEPGFGPSRRQPEFGPSPEEAEFGRHPRESGFGPSVAEPADADSPAAAAAFGSGDAGPAAAEELAPLDEPAAAPRSAADGFTFAHVGDVASRARRLARALVSDILVYHPRKVEQGRREGSLREILREEVDKSWEEYCERLGPDVARAHRPAFVAALNAILARDQPVF